MRLRSTKREYLILYLTPRNIGEVQKYLSTLDVVGIQEYVDECFSKASRLGASSRGGAWSESKVWRDKAKLGIIEKENRLTT